MESPLSFSKTFSFRTVFPFVLFAWPTALSRILGIRTSAIGSIAVIDGCFIPEIPYPVPPDEISRFASLDRKVISFTNTFFHAVSAVLNVTGR